MDPVLVQLIGQFDWGHLALAGLVFLLVGALALMRRHACRTMSDTAEATSHQRAKASAANLHEQNARLDAALNNMSQGVCMLDADARIVVFNRRFLEMYSLSPQIVKAGCTLRELIDHRIEVGLLKVDDPARYCRDILDNVAQGKATSHIIQITDGRQILACNQPMPGGGWVTTHEDVTERRKAEDRVREQTIQLDTALNNMKQGLVMFDAEARLVICNRRFLNMYKLDPARVGPGLSLRDMLEMRRDNGTFSRDPDEYVRDLKARLASGGATSLIIERKDGTVTAISNQLMPGGGWVSTHEDITEKRQAEELLRKQKVHLDTALNNMTQGINLFDSEGRLIFSNERYRQIYRLSPDDVAPGRTVRELVEARKAAGTFFDVDPEGYAQAHLDAMKRREPVDLIRQLVDGRTISIHSQATTDGSGWVVTHEDITERRRAEQERDRTQAFAATIVENVPATIIVKDARDFRYVMINRAGEAHLGLPRDKVLGKTVHDIYPKDIADPIASQDMELARTGQTQFFDDHPFTTPTGEARIITTTRLPIQDPNGDSQYLLTVIEDRTHRKRAEAQIAHMAHHDLLTGMPNRIAFTACLDATLEKAKAEKSSFALFSLNLDRFKEINDVFGHVLGDKLLCEVSRRLQSAIGGAFLARLGGDEFTVIATDGEFPGAAEAMATKILASVCDDYVVDGQNVRGGMSIGIAIYPHDGADAETLISNAEAALYRAKTDGRSIYRFFEADMDKRLRERRALQQDLQTAIERGELRLHFQPQARITGEITGFEALVRWQHPTRGMISPATFIPLAEESGLIVPIGEWIMREACREAASWAKPLQLAINFSPVQFRHGDLAGLVHTILTETGLSPKRLEVEITEGVLIGDFSRAVSILRRLKSMGVRIAMDDFGTGYSSLSYLQAFPFDKIKIDQEFISNLERNQQSPTIIRAIIGLARGLKLPVLAEGVETKAQLDFLAKERCDEVQGYLIGRPQPIEHYADLIGLPRRTRPEPPAEPGRVSRPAAAFPQYCAPPTGSRSWRRSYWAKVKDGELSAGDVPIRKGAAGGDRDWWQAV
jgi:diguanylate cyclase (GGDEF)-like protein/PAS domain S-box-containing protein